MNTFVQMFKYMTILSFSTRKGFLNEPDTLKMWLKNAVTRKVIINQYLVQWLYYFIIDDSLLFGFTRYPPKEYVSQRFDMTYSLRQMTTRILITFECRSITD